jgi:long-subunit acyl-CoA synthetase (AMP-forming)
VIQTYQSNLANFLHWSTHTPTNIFLKQPIGDNYTDYTYQASAIQVKKIATFFQQNLTEDKPKHIGILSKNSAHWILADLAISYAGAISVPFYPTLTSDQFNQVLTHSDCQILVVGKLDNWDEIKLGIPDHIKIIYTPDSPCTAGSAWQEILHTGQALETPCDIIPEEIATIVYTSGTTGTPKGVMLSNKAVTIALNLARDLAYLEKPNTRFISYLPLCHIAERNIVEFAGIAAGGTIYFVENLNTFQQNLSTTRPTHFLAVPRIWAKFKEGIVLKIGGEKKLNLLLKIPIINSLIKKKIQKGLGLDQAYFLLTGAAPMPPELSAWFQKIGLYIQEAYGMTENIGLNTFMPRHDIRLGTVGKVHPICETRIDPATGEIQMRSEYNTIGYYKADEITAELYDGEWLKTGDMGQLDPDNYLKIIGRVKDNFKTAKGQYVSPAPIENQFTLSTLVEQVCVVGINLPQPIALIVPSQTAKSLTKEQALEAFETLRTQVNPNFKKYEHIQKIIVLKNEWTVENRCLTPTLKIRRMEIEQKFNALFEMWYETKESIIFE